MAAFFPRGKTDICYAVPQMWGVSRWTARFLVLIMLVPAFGPMAMPCAALAVSSHCTRHPVSAQPPMACHHAMAPSKQNQSESSKTSVQSSNAGNCCQNHCCCGATTSEWAQPASNLFFVSSLLIEPLRPSQGALLHSSNICRRDSARAPPRS
jgi:hypothetical protein